MILTSPHLMDLPDWADCAVMDARVGGVSSLTQEDKWQEWGAQFLSAISAAGVARGVVPDPYQFDDWRAWADRLCEIL